MSELVSWPNFERAHAEQFVGHMYIRTSAVLRSNLLHTCFRAGHLSFADTNEQCKTCPAAD